MSFIQDYHLMTANTKPCKEFHAWSMLSALSVFAGRRFWFPFGHMCFYPNLYVVLVGDPGCGKSTAMNRPKSIVRAAGVCPIAASQITKEALAQKMSSTFDGKPKKTPFEGRRTYAHAGREIEYNQYAIFATELTQFIGVNPIGFLEFLTAVWDEPIIEVETKNKGHDFVTGPYITMLACMTPDIVKGYLKMNVLSSGFARRTAFVYDTGKNIIPWPNRTQEQIDAELRLVEFGKALQSRSGPFSITPDCAKFYEEWNQKNEETIIDRHPNVRGWYESKGEMLFKVSMLIALATNCQDLVIELPHYKLALHYCALLEKNLERVFEGTGSNPNAGVISQVVRMLEGLGRPMNRKQLIGMFLDNVANLRDFDDSLTHLVSCGRLKEFNVQINGELKGTLIGSPESFRSLTSAQAVALLALRAAPPPESDTDSSSGERPPVPPPSAPEG